MSAGNWQDLLTQDHTVIEKVFAAMNEMFDSPRPPRPSVVHDLLDFLINYVDRCHSRKEEEHLFVLLEQHGMSTQAGPLGVMLAEHEQSRAFLRQIRKNGRAYVSGDASRLDELRQAFRGFSQLLGGHFWKENDILYPMAARFLSPAEAIQVVQGIESIEADLGDDTRAKYYALADKLTTSLDDLSESLDRKVLAAVLNTLPVEISFVDADDRVVYFSHEDHDKIFPRNRSSIGLQVHECHPEKSVHLVMQIIEDFKAGRRDVAEFWIDFKETKVHIRYYPVHDDAGQYLGTVEVVQDVGAIQSLAGQKRLIDEAG